MLVPGVLMGCNIAPKQNAGDFFVAARYDVKPSPLSHTVWEQSVDVQYDFARIAELGFDTVLLNPACWADAKTALDAASTQHLGVVLAIDVQDRPAEAGRARTMSKNGASYLPIPAALLRHEALRGAVVEAGCSRSGASRAVDVCSSVSRAGLRCVPIFEASHLAESGRETQCRDAGEITASAPAVVDASMIAAKGVASPKQQLLGQYHAALSGGLDGGLVVSGWQHDDTPQGQRFDSLPAPRAAVAALLDRAKRWGPRLVGSKVVTNDASASCAPCFRLTTFLRGERRYLLIFNPAPDHSARGELRIPARFADGMIQRAVEIPGEDTPTPGNVYHVAHGRIAIALELTPGDAKLFEIF